jgi:hypothetical protein
MKLSEYRRFAWGLLAITAPIVMFVLILAAPALWPIWVLVIVVVYAAAIFFTLIHLHAVEVNVATYGGMIIGGLVQWEITPDAARPAGDNPDSLAGHLPPSRRRGSGRDLWWTCEQCGSLTSGADSRFCRMCGEAFRTASRLVG